MTKIEIPTVAVEEEHLPLYASSQAAGADVRACISEEMVIEAGTSLLVPTGLFFALPEGYEIQVRPRSGLALKHGITVLNSPGTIDADYRGELKIILINHGKNPFVVTPGMRIAQIVVSPVLRVRFVREKSLLTSATERGERGFGHTGI
jgi:dUTP pyrophosphatase